MRSSSCAVTHSQTTWWSKQWVQTTVRQYDSTTVRVYIIYIYIYIYIYINMKIPNNSKIQKSKNKIQNMSYGTYINNKIQFRCIRTVPTLSKIANAFWHLGCISYDKLLFWISYSDAVYLTLYGNMVPQQFLWVFDISWKKKSQKCEQFSYGSFVLRFMGI